MSESCMKFSLFQGCKIPYHLPEYGVSARAALEHLGVELVDLEFTCCGDPVRNIHFMSFLFSAARNLALSERRNLNVMTLCKCCYGALKHAEYRLGRNPGLRDKINALLREEGLEWRGTIEIRHLLSVLAEDVGPAAMRERVKKSFNDCRIVVQYGCHALRPGNITRFDNPLNPDIFESLLRAIGVDVLRWSSRLDCCGSPLWETNRRLSLDFALKKLESARAAGADRICTACTHCQIQFRNARAELSVGEGNTDVPSPLLYSQLLCASFGLSPANDESTRSR